MVFIIRFMLAAALTALFVSPDADAKVGFLSYASLLSSFAVSSAAREPKPASAKKAEPCKGQHCGMQYER